MATSGSNWIPVTSYDSLGFVWERTSYSVVNNSSTIAWQLQLKSTSNGAIASSATKAYTVTVNGTTYKGYNSIAIGNNTTKTLASGTTTITHNSDGTKTFSYSYSQEFAITFNGVYIGTKGSSYTGALNAIPKQATIASAPNFNDEENPTITYSNPAGNAVTSLQVCISLTGATDDIAYREVGKTSTSYTFNLTDAERDVLRNATTGSNSRTVKFYVKTVIGSTNYYSSLGKTFTVINAAPTLEPTVADVDAKTLALTGSADRIVKYYSDASIAFGATALKGATITNKKVMCNAKTLTEDGTLEDVESGTFIFYATDSRGNTVTKQVNKTFVKYVKLTCNMEVAMPTTEGNTTVKVSGNAFIGLFGAKTNSLGVYYRYKESGGEYGAWVSVSHTTSGNTYSTLIDITGLDYQKTYTFQAMARDLLEAIETEEVTVKTTPVYDWSADDFNINVPLHMNGNQVLRATDTNRVVLSAEGADIFIRPNGSTTDAGQVRFMPDGRIAIDGSIMNDFVVEQGTSGIWTYRKWASGKIELWTREIQHKISFTTASTGISYSTQSGIQVPLVKTIEFATGDSTKWHYVNWASVTNNDGTTLGIRYYGLNTNGNGNTIPFSAYVIGTWK